MIHVHLRCSVMKTQYGIYMQFSKSPWCYGFLSIWLPSDVCTQMSWLSQCRMLLIAPPFCILCTIFPLKMSWNIAPSGVLTPFCNSSWSPGLLWNHGGIHDPVAFAVCIPSSGSSQPEATWINTIVREFFPCWTQTRPQGKELGKLSVSSCSIKEFSPFRMLCPWWRVSKISEIFSRPFSHCLDAWHRLLFYLC